MSADIITLTIQAKGEIISSNFPAFAEMVRERLAEINRDLQTDEDFDQADSDAKAIAGAESALKLAKAKALQDAEQLHALFTSIDELSGDLAKARLDLSKQINAQKEKAKSAIIEDHLAEFDIDSGLARKHYLAGLQSEIKGKRTLESMSKACEIYQRRQQDLINKCRKILCEFEIKHGADLISDWRTLELETPAGLEAELRRRVEAKLAADKNKGLKDQLAKAQPPEPIKTPGANPQPVAGQAAHEEWTSFREVCKTAFLTIKHERDNLKYSINISKASGLSNGFNAIWKEWA